MRTKEKHIHKFERPLQTKILLTQGRKAAYDMLQQRKCVCGKVETYDLERTIV